MRDLAAEMNHPATVCAARRDCQEPLSHFSNSTSTCGVASGDALHLTPCRHSPSRLGPNCRSMCSTVQLVPDGWPHPHTLIVGDVSLQTVESVARLEMLNTVLDQRLHLDPPSAGMQDPSPSLWTNSRRSVSSGPNREKGWPMSGPASS